MKNLIRFLTQHGEESHQYKSILLGRQYVSCLMPNMRYILHYSIYSICYIVCIGWCLQKLCGQTTGQTSTNTQKKVLTPQVSSVYLTEAELRASSIYDIGMYMCIYMVCICVRIYHNIYSHIIYTLISFIHYHIQAYQLANLF